MGVENKKCMSVCRKIVENESKKRIQCVFETDRD